MGQKRHLEHIHIYFVYASLNIDVYILKEIIELKEADDKFGQ